MLPSPDVAPTLILPERLADIRRSRALLSDVESRDIALLLEELERRREADVPRLRWEPHRDGSSWFGYAGVIVQASVYQILDRDDFNWEIKVHSKYIVKGSGRRKTAAAARRAAQAAWAKWCYFNGLAGAIDQPERET